MVSWQEILLFALAGFIVTWAGTFLINLIRVPSILHSEQEIKIVDLAQESQRVITKLSQEKSQLQAQAVASDVPKVNEFEQHQRQMVIDKLGGATSKDYDALKMILQHGMTDDRLVRGQDFIDCAVKLKNLGLVQDRFGGPHNQERFWYVNELFVDALKYVLFQAKKSP